ncbi:MAG: VOC family protein [Nibricoccus sp.]
MNYPDAERGQVVFFAQRFRQLVEVASFRITFDSYGAPGMVSFAGAGHKHQEKSDEKNGVFHKEERSGRGADPVETGLSWQLIPIMINYKEIAFTAYAVTNMRKARKFYEGVLGLKPAREMGKNFVEYDIGQGTISVGCAPKMWPPSKKGTTAALEVTDFEEALEHLKKKKIKPALGPLDFPSCRMVGVRDPDGNMIVLHKRKKK